MNNMRGYYEATINGEKYGLKFNSNCFRLYSEERGIEFHQIGEIVGYDDICFLIWCAGKAWSLVNKTDWPFDYNQVENFVDDLEDSEMAKITHAIQNTRVFGIELQAGQVEEEAEEKK